MDLCTGLVTLDPILAFQLLGKAWATRDGVFERSNKGGLRYEWVHVYWDVVHTIVQRARRYACLGTYAERFNGSLYVEKLAHLRSCAIANLYLEHDSVLSHASLTFPENSDCYTLRLEPYGLKALTVTYDTWACFVYSMSLKEDWFTHYDTRDPRPIAVARSLDRESQTYTYLGSLRTNY